MQLSDVSLLQCNTAICTNCDLHSKISKGPMPFVIGKNGLPVLFVTSSPTPEEYRNGYPFASKNSWDLLCNTLMSVGFTDPRFHRTNAVKCHTPSSDFKGNTEAELRVCHDWLDQEIQLLQPKVIVAFGSVAAHRFSAEYLSGVITRKKEIGGITDKHGKIEWNTTYNCWVLYCIHPSFVLRNLGKHQQFHDALSKLYELCTNDYKIVEQATEIKYTCFLPEITEPEGEREASFLRRAKEFLVWLRDKPEYAVDLETTGLDWFTDDILMISFSWAKGRAVCVEWHPGLYDDFRAVLENPANKILQNGKFDYQFLKYRYGIQLNNFSFDTMIAAHLIDENSYNGLETLQARYLGMPVYKEVFWKEKAIFDKKTDKTDEEIYAFTKKFMEYACADSDYTFRLKCLFEPMLKEPFPGQSQELKLTPWDVFTRVSMPYVPILAEIEHNGIPYNKVYHQILSDKLHKDKEIIFQKAKQVLVDTMFPDHFVAYKTYISDAALVFEKALNEVRLLVAVYPETISDIFAEELQGYIEDFMNVADVITVTTLVDQIPNLLYILRSKKGGRFVGLIPSVSKVIKKLDKISAISVELGKAHAQLENLYHWLGQLVDFQFNIGSSKDMCYYLYNVLRLPILEKTAKGAPSTKEGTLKKLYDKHEFVRYVVEYRKIEHDISNYINGVLAATVPITGRVHPSFSQTRTVTGRLSCSDPAMHGIKRVFAIRNAFAPDNSDLSKEPTLFIEGDYSQAEVRFLGIMSRDPVLMDALQAGGDIHEENARRIFNVPDGQKVTKEQRSVTKQIVFAIIYGSLVSSIAKSLSIEVGVAQSYFDKFYGVYTTVKSWMDGMKKFVAANGFVSNYYGRIRRLPTIWSSDEGHRLEALRQCINAPIQGSATGDMVGLTHQKIQRFIDTTPEYTNCVKQIHNHHDAIITEAPARLALKLCDEIKEIAESADETLPIKMKFDVDVVCCWGGAPMTEGDIENYIAAHKAGELPTCGYCDYVDDKGKVCGGLFLPFPGQMQCPDHYKKGSAEKCLEQMKNQNNLSLV